MDFGDRPNHFSAGVANPVSRMYRSPFDEDDGTDPASADELRLLQSTADSVADDVRVHLSDAFEVDAQVVTTPSGPTAAVSVQPPKSPPLAAGISLDDLDELTDDERRELTVELVAAAVGRAKSNVGGQFLAAGQ